MYNALLREPFPLFLIVADVFFILKSHLNIVNIAYFILPMVASPPFVSPPILTL